MSAQTKYELVFRGNSITPPASSPSVHSRTDPLKTSVKQTKREERVEIRNGDLRVIMHRPQESSESSIEGSALDISANGIKLRVAEAPGFQERVELEFESENGELALRVEAEVRWIRPEEDEWAIGCLISDPLPQKSIQAIHQVSGIDRRKSERVDLEFSAIAQTAATTERFDVNVLDCSDHGVRFSTSTPLVHGERLKLLLQSENEKEVVEVMSTVKWIRELDTSYIVGCEVSKSSQTAFRRSTQAVKQSRIVLNPLLHLWLAIGLMSVILLAGWYASL